MKITSSAFLIILFVLMIILILIIKYVSFQNEDYTTTGAEYVTKTWQTSMENNKTDILFPEKCLPRFQKSSLIGLSYSGGGSRSYTSMIGYMRGLVSTGLYKNVDYVSTNSGGSWFNSVYTIAKTNGFTDSELLGRSIELSKMNLINLSAENFTENLLKIIGINKFMGARINNGGIAAGLLFELTINRRVLYDCWNYAIGENFLGPYGLNEKILTLNNTYAEDITKNTKIKKEDILTLKDTDPFCIFVGCLICNIEKGTACPYKIVEMTPLYSGILQSNKLSDNTIIGGYVVENFAFGCAAPFTPLKYTDYSSLVNKYSTYCSDNPFNVTVKKAEHEVFMVRDMIGISSAAYASIAYSISQKLPLIDLNLLTPSYRIWYKNIFSPTTSDSQCSLDVDINLSKTRCKASKGYDDDSCSSYLGKCYSISAPQCSSGSDCSYNYKNSSCNNKNGGSSYYCRYGFFKCDCITKNREQYNKKPYKSRFVQIGDGVHTENLGIIPLISRGVNKIICFANSDSRIFDDNGNVLKDTCYTDISNLFGYKKNKDCDSYKFINIEDQVFNESDYDLVFNDFKNSFVKGGPTYSRRKLNVIQNTYHGVKGGYEVDILFLLLQPSKKFLNSVPSGMKKIIESDFFQIIFQSFPSYPTVFPNPPLLIQLTNLQINLLSTFTHWSITQPEVMAHVKDLLTV